jgi:hypothetical protein
MQHAMHAPRIRPHRPNTVPPRITLKAPRCAAGTVVATCVASEARLPRANNLRTESTMLFSKLLAPATDRRKIVLLAVLAFIALC